MALVAGDNYDEVAMDLDSNNEEDSMTTGRAIISQLLPCRLSCISRMFSNALWYLREETLVLVIYFIIWLPALSFG